MGRQARAATAVTRANAASDPTKTTVTMVRVTSPGAQDWLPTTFVNAFPEDAPGSGNATRGLQCCTKVHTNTYFCVILER